MWLSGMFGPLRKKARGARLYLNGLAVNVCLPNEHYLTGQKRYRLCSGYWRGGNRTEFIDLGLWIYDQVIIELHSYGDSRKQIQHEGFVFGASGRSISYMTKKSSLFIQIILHLDMSCCILGPLTP